MGNRGIWGSDLWLTAYLIAANAVMHERGAAIVRLLGATANVLDRSSDLTDDEDESRDMRCEAGRLRHVQSFYEMETGCGYGANPTEMRH